MCSSDLQTPAQTFDNVLTDAVFTCNARKAAKLITAQGVPLYAYEFADANAPMVFKIAPRPEARRQRPRCSS